MSTPLTYITQVHTKKGMRWAVVRIANNIVLSNCSSEKIALGRQRGWERRLADLARLEARDLRPPKDHKAEKQQARELAAKKARPMSPESREAMVRVWKEAAERMLGRKP